MSVVDKELYNTKPPEGDPLDDEMRSIYKKIMSFDNKPAIEIARSAAQKTGVNPALLFSSAYQEGMNKAIVRPDEVSEAYINAENNEKLDTRTFPVDGFYSYGLDTFGDQYNKIKKYLPEGFEKTFKTYSAKNEKGETVKTAAFTNNEAALIAKGAMLRFANDEINDYAKQKGIIIDPADMDYFTLARYNTSLGNVKSMLNEYQKSNNKRGYIDKGETAFKQVHRNISPRLKRVSLANELLNQQ